MKVNSLLDKHQSYILAVDDEEMNRYVLDDLIGLRYDLLLAESGAECLERINQKLPELILLDINMPGVDGFELCQHLKSDPKTRHIPIIFLTAQIAVEDERRGLELGAVDYITKPFSESILLARIETHLSLSSTQRQLEHSNATLQKERDYIEYIMLTMRSDVRYVTQDLKALVSPVEQSNGDLVLSALAPNGHRYVMVADFTGHGLSAAMAGPLVNSLFYSQTEQGGGLKQTAEIINAELCRKLPAEVFMAATFIDWDPQTNQVEIWNRGMPPVLHYRDNQCIDQVASSGFALGITEDTDHETAVQSFNCRSGDVLFGYSDGIQEATSSSGEQFGDQRVMALLAEVLSEEKELESVLTSLHAYSDGGAVEDDATLIQLIIK